MPDLTAHNQAGIKTEITQQHGVGRSEDPENNIGDGEISHQIRYSKIGMLVTEAVNQPHGVFHNVFLQEILLTNDFDYRVLLPYMPAHTSLFAKEDKSFLHGYK